MSLSGSAAESVTSPLVESVASPSVGSLASSLSGSSTSVLARAVFHALTGQIAPSSTNLENLSAGEESSQDEVAETECQVGGISPKKQTDGQSLPSVTEQVKCLLKTVGQTVEDLANRRQERRDAGLAWPFAVPVQERPGVGAAQLRASVIAVCQELGLGEVQRTVRDSSRPLDAVDARLIAECPPHHGSVG